MAIINVGKMYGSIYNHIFFGIDCSAVVLGGIPVHTEYRCLFFLRY